MKLLIKDVLLLHPAADNNGEKTDIFINDGRIERIGKGLKTEDAVIFDAKGACVSPGWFDLGTLIGDPGLEHREDFASAAKAAAAGGFTALACMPNTHPATHSKSEVLYVKNQTRNGLVEFLPIGAVSQDCAGKDITEIYDMRAAGAVAFSDGKKSLQDSGLMLRALQYVKPFDGVILNQPFDKSAAPGGQMHEGLMSTSLGLRGIPSLSEELMAQRDIHLAEYTGSRLHLLNISTAGTVGLVREAKKRGLSVTTSVAAMNLAHDDSALHDFDANFKVMPPLRAPADLEALKHGLQDGTIDCITTNHTPLDEEVKNLEFPYALFGAIGLQTAFALSWMHLHNVLSLHDLFDKWAIQPRRILNLPVPEIAEGAWANLTIFDPEMEWTVSEKGIFSKSKNTPYLGATLRGKVLGTVNGTAFVISEK